MITLELLLAIATFAFVTTITPGPNNIMLTVSGANFGFKRTLLHLAGIVVGVAVLHLAAGLGLATVLKQIPAVEGLLKMMGSAYLLWLALKLLRFQYNDEGSTDKNTAKPLSLWQGMTFQCVNPKVWMMVVSANASFAVSGDAYWLSVLWIVVLFATVGAASNMIWIRFGQFIRRYLQQAEYLRIFNITMAIMTAACVVLIWK